MCTLFKLGWYRVRLAFFANHVLSDDDIIDYRYFVKAVPFPVVRSALRMFAGLARDSIGVAYYGQLIVPLD
jgi:hypothetical protein